jgi:hypothetical protein
MIHGFVSFKLITPFPSQPTSGIVFCFYSSCISLTMADSAPKIAAEERYEASEVVERKAQTLVNQIRKSKHFIAVTGAGISTSAG